MQRRYNAISRAQQAKNDFHKIRSICELCGPHGHYRYRTIGTVADLKREAAKVGLVANASTIKYTPVGGTEHDRIRVGSINAMIDDN